MRNNKRRWVYLGAAAAALVVAPAALWVLLTRQPEFYRRTATMPPELRKAEAKVFESKTLQLRDDIVNEGRWEAVFTDEQVNAWLAGDLVEHFADRIPQGVHEPRVLFEMDRVHFGFGLDQGPVRSVVSVEARVRVSGEHEVALTIESIRAGVVPIPAERLLERVAEKARRYGLEVRWEQDGEFPVAVIQYTPDPRRRDVILDKLLVLDGQVRLAGRSSPGRSLATPNLPGRRVLQSTFPGAKRKVQPPPPPRDNSASPLSLRPSRRTTTPPSSQARAS